MIESYKEFLEKYPDSEAFEKDFPVGMKFKWWDHDTWHIVGYVTDAIFKTENYKEYIILVKSWNKYKQRWCYQTRNIFSFYYDWQTIESKKNKKQ